MSTPWRRASPLLLIAEAGQFLVSFVLLVVALVFWAGRGSDAAPVLLGFAILGYAPLRLAWVALRWIVETYRLDADTLVVRNGVIRRQERHLGWASIVAVDEQAGLVFRALGIRRLQLTQSDATGGAVVFRALDPQSADAVRRLAQIHFPAGSDTSPPDMAQSSGVIYRASWRELALMSVVNGRFALLAPPLLFAVWSLLSDLGVSTWAFSMFESLPPSLLIVLSALGYVLLGTLATISRYQGFSARVNSDRTLVLTYGLVEKRERHIDLASIEGVTLRRSLVEQILRRSRLAVLTFKGTDDVGASLVLPSLPDAVVRRIAHSHFDQFVRGSVLLADRPAPVFRQSFRALLVYVVPVSLGVLAWETWGNVVGASAVALIALGISTGLGRLLVSGIAVDAREVVKVERHLVTELETYVRARAVHSVSAVHVRGVMRPVAFSLHLYAGGARHFAGVHCSAGTLRRLVAVVETADQPAALRQRSWVRAGEASS